MSSVSNRFIQEYSERDFKSFVNRCLIAILEDLSISSTSIGIGNSAEISFGQKLAAISGNVLFVYPTTADVAYNKYNSDSSKINISKESLTKQVDVENLTTSPLHLLSIREGGHVDAKLSDHRINKVIILQVAPDRVSCDVIFDHGNKIDSVVGRRYPCMLFVRRIH